MFLAVFTAALLNLLGMEGTQGNTGVTACRPRLLEGTGNRSCIEPDPFFIFGRGPTIFRADMDRKGQRRIVGGSGSSGFMDYRYSDQSLYWVNVKSGFIQRSFFNGTQKQKVHFLGRGVTGFAVDWIHGQVVWSSAENGTIEGVGTNGTNSRTLLANVTSPSGVVVDANDRLIFWISDNVTSSLQRSNLDTGKTSIANPTTLISADRIETLALDVSDKLLFWLRSGPDNRSAVGSCDYHGRSVSIIKLPLGYSPRGMAVFLQHIYFADARSRAIVRMDKHTGDFVAVVKGVRRAAVGLKVVHPLLQPEPEISPSILEGAPCDVTADDCVGVCSRETSTGRCRCSSGFALSRDGSHCEDVNECALWNHGCTLGCVNVPGSYLCTCPRGFVLLPDMKTCQELLLCRDPASRCGHGCVHIDGREICACPEGSVLQPDGTSCSGCSHVDNGGCSQVCLPLGYGHWECVCQPGYQLHPDGRRCLATGPSPYLMVANELGVRRIGLDGTGDYALVEDPMAAVIALDYDPVEGKVYFASGTLQIERANLDGSEREVLVSQETEAPAGLAVDWMNRKLYWTDQGLARIERADLKGFNREVLVRTSLHKPRAIVIHPEAKKLFWTDVGDVPAVWSSSLDGSGRVLHASSGLLWPSGLALDYVEHWLYWCDERTGRIERAGLDGSHRRVLSDNQVGRPFNLAVFEDALWVANRDQSAILRLDKHSGENVKFLHSNMVHPAALVVVHPIAKPGTNTCLYENGGCEQVCESRWGASHCSCHSGFTLLSPAKGSCVPTSAYALKNETLNDKVAPPTSQEGERAMPVTEKMVSGKDRDECLSLQCDANAQCQLNENGSSCQCLQGFTGDGKHCVESTNPTISPDVTTHHHNQSATESCPASHDSYCLYNGVCFYFPDIKTYACHCVSGYVGERCQFSDLEWWQLQQDEQEKQRNLTIAVCMVVLISLLCVTACSAYGYSSRRFPNQSPKTDEVTGTGGSDSIASDAPQLYIVVEPSPDLGRPTSSSRSSPAVERGASERTTGIPREEVSATMPADVLHNLILLEEPLERAAGGLSDLTRS